MVINCYKVGNYSQILLFFKGVLVKNLTICNFSSKLKTPNKVECLIYAFLVLYDIRINIGCNFFR